MHRCVVVLDLCLMVGRALVRRSSGLVRLWSICLRSWVLGGVVLVRAESFQDGSGGAAADLGDADENGDGRESAVTLAMPLGRSSRAVRGGRRRLRRAPDRRSTRSRDGWPYGRGGRLGRWC